MKKYLPLLAALLAPAVYGAAINDITYHNGTSWVSTKISELTTETAPVSGDLVLCEESGGALRSCDIGDMVVGTASLIVDGDKGDVTVSGTGTAWTITEADPLAVLADGSRAISGNLEYSPTTFVWSGDDVANDQSFTLAGGSTGAMAAGAFISLYGNSAASNPGRLALLAGTNGSIMFSAGGVSNAIQFDGATFLSTVVDFDFGGAVLQIPNGTTLPATCDVGDQFMDTDQTSGQRHYLCESANTWEKQGDGAPSSPSVLPLIWRVTNNTTAITESTEDCFRVKDAMTLTGISATVVTGGSTSGTLTVDVNEDGTTIMSTNKLDIQYNATVDDDTAAISDASIAAGALICAEVDTMSTGETELGLAIILE